MSILLSVYFREGIVFAADKNATLTFADGTRDVEVGKFTKVLAWPYRRAAVGWCGLGSLGGLPTDDWLRVFIAQHRDFDDLDQLAANLVRAIQVDFDREYATDPPPADAGLIIHLGGFKAVGEQVVPAMYHIYNVDMEGGTYGPAARLFVQSEDVKAQFDEWGPEDYPARVQERLGEMLDERDHILWFNNGAMFPIFNILKGHLWSALSDLRRLTSQPASLDDLQAYCRMAVSLYGSWFEEHSLPHQRAVGGGVDAVSIPWPRPPEGSK